MKVLQLLTCFLPVFMLVTDAESVPVPSDADLLPLPLDLELKCLAGWFHDRENPRICHKCGFGKYSGGGASMCEWCPSGKITLTPTSDSIDDCVGMFILNIIITAPRSYLVSALLFREKCVKCVKIF